jgi:hypothetical protein
VWRPALGGDCENEREQHRQTLAHSDATLIRLAYLAAYAALSALGAALVARPAFLWVRSQGLAGAALAWDVPNGALFAASAALLAFLTLWLATGAALRRSSGAPLHLAFLLGVGFCLALRSASGDPRPPTDPAPGLLDALRAAAEELERGWAGQYAPDAAQFSPSLAQVHPPAFRLRGGSLPLHVRVLSGAEGAQLEPLPGDPPGTVYLSVSRDRQTAWLTALTLDGTLKLPSSKPALIEAHGGTHALPGHDPAVPEYPRMRPLPGK